MLESLESLVLSGNGRCCSVVRLKAKRRGGVRFTYGQEAIKKEREVGKVFPFDFRAKVGVWAGFVCLTTPLLFLFVLVRKRVSCVEEGHVTLLPRLKRKVKTDGLKK